MKRVFGILSILLIITGSAFAAGGAQPGAASGDAPGEVLFWTPQTQPALGNMQKVVDAYNATNPVAKVRMVQVPGSETDATNLMTAVRGGTGPDVYYLDRFTTAQRANDGILVDITDDLEKIERNFMSKYVPYAREEATWRGRVYALPHNTDTRGLYVNIQMLRDAGVDPAVLDYRRGAPSMALIREISRKIDTKDAQGQYTKVGFIPQLGQGWHYTWGFAYGGKFADLAGGKVTPTDPGVVSGLQFLYDWNREMGVREVQSFISSYLPPNAPPQTHPFITGNLAMVINTNSYPVTMAQYAPDVEFDCAYLPVVKEGDKPYTWSGGWSLTLPVGTKRKDAAVAFIAWAAGEPGNRIYVREQATFPSVAALINELPTLLPNMKPALYLSLPNSNTRPPLPIAALYWDALSRAQDLVVQNAQTPLQALQEVEAQVQPQLIRFLPLQ